LVSVIIPSRNRPALLQRAIDSVSAQGHSRIEVVIFDNFSDQPIVQSEIRSRFPLKIVRSSVFEPKPIAVNRAFSASEGQFICYLDDDDQYRDSKILSCLRLFASVPDVDMVYGNIEQRFADDSTMIARGPPQITEFLRWRYIHVNSIMLRRAVLQKVQYDERMTTFEDVMFIGQIMRLFQVAHIDEVHAIWYRDGRPDQLTNRNWRRSYENWKRLCLEFTKEISQDRSLRLFYYRKLMLLSMRFFDLRSMWFAWRGLIGF